MAECRRSSIAEALYAEAEAIGLADCRIEKTKRGHPRFYFRRPDGVERFVVFSSSSGDEWRGWANAVRDLRREAGVRRVVQKSARRGQRKQVCKPRTVVVEKTAVKGDPFASLTGLRSQLEMEARMRRRARRRRAA